MLHAAGANTAPGLQRTGRVCRGMELEPKYADVAVRHWLEHTGEEATLKGGDTWSEVEEERS